MERQNARWTRGEGGGRRAWGDDDDVPRDWIRTNPKPETGARRTRVTGRGGVGRARVGRASARTFGRDGRASTGRTRAGNGRSRRDPGAPTGAASGRCSGARRQASRRDGKHRARRRRRATRRRKRRRAGDAPRGRGASDSAATPSSAEALGAASAASSASARTTRRCARWVRDRNALPATDLPPMCALTVIFAGAALAEALTDRPAKAWVQVAMAAIVSILARRGRSARRVVARASAPAILDAENQNPKPARVTCLDLRLARLEPIRAHFRDRVRAHA